MKLLWLITLPIAQPVVPSAIASRPAGEARKARPLGEHEYSHETHRDCQNFSAPRANAECGIDQDEKQGNHGNEGNNQAGRNGLFGIGHAAHATTEHQRADEQGVAPLGGVR